jgi:hypothetical protein
MATGGHLVCDGCGQAAGQEHIAQRLKRLENMTRYRPIHVQALLLGAVSPDKDEDYAYSAVGEFKGVGAELLDASGVEHKGRSVEATLVDFQRRGYLLTYLLECPAHFSDPHARTKALLEQFATTATRIRRSLKPKKVVVFGSELDALVPKLTTENLGAELVLAENGRPFRLEELKPGSLVTAVTAAVTPSL